MAFLYKISEVGETLIKQDDNKNNDTPFLNILFRVHLHCQGCIQKLRKYALRFPGVFKVEFEGELTMKVMAEKNVNVDKLRKKLEKKTSKTLELVSPQPSTIIKDKVEDKEKPKEVPITTAELKVQYHCQGCLEKIHKALKSYKGMHEVRFDRAKETVKVSGRIDVKTMMDEISKKLHRPILIVPEDDKKHQQANNNNGGGEDKKDDVKVEYWVNGLGYVGLYDGPGQVFHTPKYLSDDTKHQQANNDGAEDKKDNFKVGYLVNGLGYMGLYDGSGQFLPIFDTPRYLSDDNPNACSVM